VGTPGDLSRWPSYHLWRWLPGACGTLLTLLVMVWLVYELAAERLPRHRAALESLVRDQTHLDLRFAQLRLRWGWYGPEAVLSDVELGEPIAGPVVVRAPQLVVGLDAWRLLRGGEPQSERIALTAPDIVLLPTSPAPAAAGRDRGAASVALARGAHRHRRRDAAPAGQWQRSAGGARVATRDAAAVRSAVER
jgi:hypothetical protein